MKNKIYLFGTLLLFGLLITSCQKDQAKKDPKFFTGEEYKFVRLAVSDTATNVISLLSPTTGKVEMYNGKHRLAFLYPTESSRFLTLIYRRDNLVEFFDTGFEEHGDHMHVRGTPKFANKSVTGNLPTHYKSKLNNILIFNDGDGTLITGREDQIHNDGVPFATINASLGAHHGAMAPLSNGLFAITKKDGSITGTLPERVVVVDKSGKEIHNSKIQTKGIHGNATDGDFAVFGSASGVLVVDKNGEQFLIDNPSDFGTAWFGTIYESAEKGKFVAYTGSKGAWLVDVKSKTLSPIASEGNFATANTSKDQKYFVGLQRDGKVLVYDILKKTLKSTINLNMNFPSTDPSFLRSTLVASSNFVYVALPKTSEIVMLDIAKSQIHKTFKVNGVPYRMAVIGQEFNEAE